MSDVVDLPLVILQKAQHAAEAAAASAKLLESEAGHRLTAIEARLVAVDNRLLSAEARLSALYAGQNAHTLALMRIADTQSEHTVRFAEHTARFDAIDNQFAEHTARFDAIDNQFAEHTARFDAIDKGFDGIVQTLASILAKLP